MNNKYLDTKGLTHLYSKINDKLKDKQDVILKFTDVNASQWVEDDTYVDYHYRCDIACAGVTSDMYAEVVFDINEAISGNYAPVCETKSNVVSVWSVDDIEIIIPTIIITK